MAEQRPRRFVLYSHDCVGLGHIRRNLAIASAVVQRSPDASVLLVTGNAEAERLGLDAGIDFLKLPSLRKRGAGGYTARRLAVSAGELSALRARQIAAAVEEFQPDVMLADKHPEGVGGELRPALDALARSGGAAVAGFRDILDDPVAVRREWGAEGVLELIEAHYRAVLIYGMPQVTNFVTTYGLSKRLAGSCAYTGYVVHNGPCANATVDALPRELLAPARRPVVLATAGGGEDGERLLRTFVDAAVGAPWQGIVVTGPEIPSPARHRLRRAAAGAGVGFHGFAQDLPGWFRHTDALVSMGGYNTLVEALWHGTPTVCVPRTSPRVEQSLRARAFERLGLLRMLDPQALRPGGLRDKVDEALRQSRDQLKSRARSTLDFDGAPRAAEFLLRLADRTGAAGSTAGLPRSRLAVR